MHEIGVIYFDGLFSIIFFRLLWFSEANGIVMLCMENETPRINKNHNEPFTSETCSCSSKACLLCLKGAYLKLKGFGAHSIAVIRAGVSGSKGHGEKIQTMFLEVHFSWDVGFCSVHMCFCESNSMHAMRRYIDNTSAYAQHLYHTLPWTRSGLREYTPPHLKDVKVSDSVEMSSECLDEIHETQIAEAV